MEGNGTTAFDRLEGGDYFSTIHRFTNVLGGACGPFPLGRLSQDGVVTIFPYTIIKFPS